MNTSEAGASVLKKASISAFIYLLRKRINKNSSKKLLSVHFSISSEWAHNKFISVSI